MGKRGGKDETPVLLLLRFAMALLLLAKVSLRTQLDGMKLCSDGGGGGGGSSQPWKNHVRGKSALLSVSSKGERTKRRRRRHRYDSKEGTSVRLHSRATIRQCPPMLRFRQVDRGGGEGRGKQAWREGSFYFLLQQQRRWKKLLFRPSDGGSRFPSFFYVLFFRYISADELIHANPYPVRFAGADLIRFSAPLVVLSRLRHSLPPPSNG